MNRHLSLIAAILLLCCGALSAQTSGDCRMDESQIRPVIDRYNPFFTDHTWEDDSKTETARLDPTRILIIKQKACLRHHVLFSMHVEASEIEDNDRFWISEMLVMLKRVYFNDPNYLEYKKAFEKEYIRQFLAAGLNSTFTFPIDDRTFICRIDKGDWGAKVKLESVKFLLKEKVIQPGIAREKDDGWYINKKPR
ncbi:MAG: hypothetical protein U0176_17735 [Bacteroidia bacterium]